MTSIEEKPTTIHRAVARCFWLDAMDFLRRFDVLWERETHKTGRIKTFVDLLLACECALKSHAMLGSKTGCPDEVYRELRKAGHKIGKLADLAYLNADRSKYEFVKANLHKISILIRYSLEAHDTFFPELVDWRKAKITYSETISNQLWVMSIRNCVKALIEELSPHFTGPVTVDFENIFSDAEEMRNFMLKAKR